MGSKKLTVGSDSHRLSRSSFTSSKSSLSAIKDQPVDTDDIDEDDESGHNIILNIISQLRPGCDLTRITLPTFILEKKSMLERVTNQLQFPEFLLQAHSEQDPLQRFLHVMKWYLAGWHIAPKAVKKPLNPVLGEYFTAYWDLPNKQQAYYIAEQTSHHPPECAYFYMIPESSIRVDGVVIPKSRFLGNSSAAMMDGSTVLQFLDIKDRNGKPEKYILTQPNVYVRGILFGKMRIELGDHMIIKSPDFQADIEFKTKGYVFGTYDAIEGTVKDYDGNSYYEISGKWNDVMYIKDLKQSRSSPKVFLDTHKESPLRPQVRPLNEQGEYESRKLWNKVTDALAVRNHSVATEEKFQIENHQRQLAKKRIEDGVEFHPKLFRKSKPGEDLDYCIYRNIPVNEDPEKQIRSILQIAPILPGQRFTDKFFIPAFEKIKPQKKKIEGKKENLVKL